MKVSTKLIQNELYLYLDGELDQSVADDLRQQIDQYLDKVNPKKVIFDMKKLLFMDSTGIGLIMGRYTRMQSIGGELSVRSPSERVKKIIKLSGLCKIVKIENGGEEI